MHFADMQFAPKKGINEYDKPIFDNMYEHIKSMMSEHKAKTSLPPDYTFKVLDFNQDGDMIVDFFNKYYQDDNAEYTKSEYDNSIIDYYKCLGDEAKAYGIMYKNKFLICFINAEMVNFRLNDTEYEGAYIDNNICHPKFRHKFLTNIYNWLAILDVVKDNHRFPFFQMHNTLDFSEFTRKSVYNMYLSNACVTFRLCNHVHKLKEVNHKHMIRRCELNDLSTLKEALNAKRFKLQILYSDKRLESMLTHPTCNMIFTDDTGNIAVFAFDDVVFDKFKIKTLILADYVQVDDFKSFMWQLFKHLRDDVHVDKVIIGFKDLAKEFDLVHDSDMNVYMLNMLPKVKPNEVNMNIN